MSEEYQNIGCTCHKIDMLNCEIDSLANMKQAYEQVCLEKEELEKKIQEARACLWCACGTAVEVMDRALEILKPE